MKILVVQDHLRSGGTERQSVLLSAGFRAAGHETTLLTFRAGGALADTVARDVHRIVLQPVETGLDWWAPGLSRMARRLAPDVVLCMGRMANCRGAQLQRALPQAAVIGTLRTGRPLPWLYRRSLRRVRHVVANSREAAVLGRLHTPRLSVIHNALVFPDMPADTTNGMRERLRQQHGARADTLVLLCVAMFRPGKNQRVLIDLVSQLPADLDWQLWLAGDGPEAASCAAAIERSPHRARLRMLGWVADPTPLYTAADIAVHASQRESLSNFLIEAQAHGLPAVAYDALGISETFVPDVSGFLIPRDDAAGFRQALLQLLRDPVQRATMADAARRHARESFSAARQINTYLNLFTSLAKRGDRVETTDEH